MRIKLYVPWLKRALKNYEHGKHGRHFYAMKCYKSSGGSIRNMIYRFATMLERDEWCKAVKATPVSATEARKAMFKRGSYWTTGEISVEV